MLQRKNTDAAKVNLLLKEGMRYCLNILFYFFSCSFTHTSHNSIYRYRVPKASENRERQLTAETFFLRLCILTFHSSIINHDS